LKAKDLWNSILIVLTIFAIGCLLIIWPFREFMDMATSQIRNGKKWVPLVVGIAYVLGFFVTRTVSDSFDAIFGKAPFSDIGAVQDDKRKHPPWVDTMLKPLGYVLFLGRVVLIIGVLVVLLRLGLWLVGPKLTVGG
jgi:beta-lactamase regulating signal transducer with metallopeptidase domain